MNVLTSYSHKRASQVFFAFMLTLVTCVIFPISKSFAQTYSAPIVISKGGTYTGNWESRDSEIPAVEIRTSEPVVIENSNIRGAGYLIKSWGYSVNLTVRHTKGYGLTPTPYVSYKKPRRFVTVNNFKNVVIENCYMESTAGIYVGTRYEGNNTSGNAIRIRYNVAKNIDGRVYGGTKEHSQFVQFNFRGSIATAEIAWNQVINEAGNSLVEDNINMYNTQGVPGSPIRIHNNYIQGAYPVPHTASTGYSGGGIITDGDGDISIAPAHIEAHNNQLINLGNYCMGIAGGNNIRYHHNRAINSATFKDGTKFAMYTSGLWSKDYYKKNTTFNNSLDNNTVGITAWGYTNNRNDISVAENASFTNNTFLPAGAVPVATEAAEYTLWTQKLQQNGIVLGPNGSAGTVTATNQAPNVSITSPANGASFTAGNTVTITANATDADGTVTRVEYFSGSNKIGEATTAPFSFNWANVSAGSYTLTAKATDDKGASKTSGAVSISVAAASTSTTTPPSTGTGTGGTGKITREFWAGVAGANIADIPVTKTPTSVTELTLFEAPSNVADNYGQRIRGFVTAPESGQYTFWIAGDNSAELWLSTSEDPAKKVKLASVNGWTNPREWTKYTTQQSVKVSLEAGKRYYIEALMKEEGGGDNLAVGWQLPSGAQERPIAGNRLSQLGSTATTTTQPAPAPAPTPAPSPAPTTGTGKITREFWAGVAGASIADIPVTKTPTSVTELTLFEAPSNVADNYGQRIRGFVTAPESGQYTFWIAGDNSAELWLSTSEDPAKKVKLASVNGWTNPREWTKYTTQQSVKVSLEAGKRYYIEALMKEEGGGDNLAVGWQLPSGAQERPIAGNRLSQFTGTTTSTTTTTTTTEVAPTPAPTTTTLTTGKIMREFWASVNTESISQLPLSNKPTSVTELTSLETPSNIGDNYGQRIRGYIVAPENGQYTFWIAGDNNAELWLSTSEDPAKKVKLAYVNGWTNPREYTKYATQQSVKVTLEAGKAYYLEVLHVEGGGGDNLSVSWQLPSGAKEAPIAGKHLAPFSDVLTASASSNTVSEDVELSFDNTTAYPNPFRDMITLDFGGKDVKLQRVVLVNQAGKVVYEEKGNLDLTNSKLEINLGNAKIRSGLYFLTYTDAQGNTNAIKVIKE